MGGGSSKTSDAARKAEEARKVEEAPPADSTSVNPTTGVLNEGPWDFFISHRQVEGGRTAAFLASDLEKLGYKVWLDVNMKSISENAMMEGIANSQATIALLSDTYFSSAICQMEVRKAVQCQTTIILVSVEGIDIGKALSFAPPDLSHIGKEAAIKAIISDPDFRKVAIQKIVEKSPSASKARKDEEARKAEEAREAVKTKADAAKAKHGPKPLVFSAQKGDLEALKALLQSGYQELDEGDDSGRTALIWAVNWKGWDSQVEALLAAGANRDVQDKFGGTALIMAAMKGREGAVRLLVEAGADRSLKTVEGYTALDCAEAEEIKDILRS